jgi:hypothetical protein
MCGASCADPTRDPNNCGACGRICGSGLCGTSIAASMMSSPALWNFNGSAFHDSAAQSGVITDAVGSLSGTILYRNPITVDSFDASFDFRISGGGGADGFGFIFESSGNTVVAPAGSRLGIAGLNGYGVEFDTFGNTGSCDTHNDNHIAVDSLTECSSASVTPTALVESGTLPFTLGDGAWHTCQIHFAAGVVTVTVDGGTIIPAFAIPSYVPAPYYFGFGGSTGTFADRHEIRNVTITFPTGHCL